MRVYISGGCKNGKSTYGEKIAQIMKKKDFPLYYVATMNPQDTEDEERIKRHQRNREGMGFKTIEIGHNIKELLDNCNKRGSFLIDSTTALLANEMFTQEKSFHPEVYKKVARDICYLLEQIEDIVIVSDYIYSDADIYDKETNQYRKGLAYIDKCCAGICDVVIESFYGNFILYKGEESFWHVCKEMV